MALIRNIQLRNNYNPWISKETLEMMKTRDSLKKQASATGDRDTWLKLKK